MMMKLVFDKLLAYNPLTGHLTWLTSQGTAKAGDRAGSLNAEGYRMVQIDSQKYSAARLAWYITHGRWPTHIDHIDRCRDNNKLNNLREVTHQQNCLNRQRSQKSGFKGVYPSRDRWIAKITLKGITEYLGTFDSPEDAHLAYKTRAKTLHGAFA